jgi:hypothetical protein
VEFVEAQQPGLGGELFGDQRDRVVAIMLPEFHFLTDQVNALVHVEHEFVKMRAALSLDRTRVKKQIHQHRLAATDFAVDVKAVDRLLAVCEQPIKRGRFSRQVFRNPFFQPRHFFNDGELRLITLDAAGGDIGSVTICNGARHRK